MVGRKTPFLPVGFGGQAMGADQVGAQRPEGHPVLEADDVVGPHRFLDRHGRDRRLAQRPVLRQ